MPATVIDLIKRAMLQIGAIDIRATPSAAEAAAVLAELPDVLMCSPGWNSWTEMEISTDFAPLGNDYRITVLGEVDVEVDLPNRVYAGDDLCISHSESPPSQDGCHLVAPRDGSRCLIYAQGSGATKFYAYRSDTGQWEKVHDLVLADNVPVNVDMQGHLALMLAERVAPIFGQEVNQALVSRARLAWSVRYDRYKRPRSDRNYEADTAGYM